MKKTETLLTQFRVIIYITSELNFIKIYEYNSSKKQIFDWLNLGQKFT